MEKQKQLVFFLKETKLYLNKQIEDRKRKDNASKLGWG